MRDRRPECSCPFPPREGKAARRGTAERGGARTAGTKRAGERARAFAAGRGRGAARRDPKTAARTGGELPPSRLLSLRHPPPPHPPPLPRPPSRPPPVDARCAGRPAGGKCRPRCVHQSRGGGRCAAGLSLTPSSTVGGPRCRRWEERLVADRLARRLSGRGSHRPSACPVTVLLRACRLPAGGHPWLPHARPSAVPRRPAGGRAGFAPTAAVRVRPQRGRVAAI